MSEEKKPLLEAKGIYKDFQTLHVLENIHLELYPDEIVAIIGPSGCGKSTLLRIVSGLIPPTKGHIFYHGKEIKDLTPGMSLVFQTFALYPWMTVRENIEMVLKAIPLPVEEMKKRTDEIIKLIGLEDFKEAYPREISGGMKQRVGMARALVRKPEMLFMDEPFSEVDTFTAEVLRDEVLKIWSNKELGLSSILLVSHDVHEVAYLSDRIYVLGMNPATVKGVIINDLPRPRDYHSPEFLKLVDKLHDTYGQVKPLISCKHDEILGLLAYLKRHGGSQDTFKIGADFHQHFDKVSLILGAAELLNFVEISHRTATITSKGNEFLAANHETRRKIWKEMILAIPIFKKIYEILKKDPNQAMSRKDLIQFLRKELPHQDATSQLTFLIHWGHYAGLFTYHKKYKSITLSK